MTDLLGEHDSWSLGQLKMGEDETKCGALDCLEMQDALNNLAMQCFKIISHIIAYILILV